MTENQIIKELLKINPELKKYLHKNVNLLDNGFLDSFSIIQLILKLEQKSNKKINFSKIKRSDFASLKNIVKFVNKKSLNV